MADNTLTQEDISKMNTMNLASFVVIHKVLGSFRDEAMLCMIELMNRKEAGDTFDFENFIDQEYKKHQIKLNLESFATTKYRLSKTIMNTILNISNNTEAVSEPEEDDDDDDLDEL